MRAFIERARRTAVELERLLDDRMNALVRAAPRGLEPLEVRHAVLDEIESRLVPGPNGMQLFPYDDVVVELIGGTPDDVAALEATLDSDGGLGAAAHARLARRGCRATFNVRIEDLRSTEALRANSTGAGEPLPAAPDPGDAEALRDTTGGLCHEATKGNRYRIVFRRRGAPAEPKAAEPAPPDTVLVITMGSGTEALGCTLAAGRLDVGRVADVRDRDGRLVRQNALVVPEALDPNGTVSRRHAHLAATPGAGGISYRVFDDGSRYGTSIVRRGRTIAVHAGALGVALRDGDELHFGDAVAVVALRASTDSPSPTAAAKGGHVRHDARAENEGTDAPRPSGR
jgi:pSer/pThr/pTyr-binding forkhead associated (FHA) protein